MIGQSWVEVFFKLNQYRRAGQMTPSTLCLSPNGNFTDACITGPKERRPPIDRRPTIRRGLGGLEAM